MGIHYEESQDKKLDKHIWCHFWWLKTTFLIVVLHISWWRKVKRMEEASCFFAVVSFRSGPFSPPPPYSGTQRQLFKSRVEQKMPVSFSWKYKTSRKFEYFAKLKNQHFQNWNCTQLFMSYTFAKYFALRKFSRKKHVTQTFSQKWWFSHTAECWQSFLRKVYHFRIFLHAIVTKIQK